MFVNKFRLNTATQITGTISPTKFHFLFTSTISTKKAPANFIQHFFFIVNCMIVSGIDINSSMLSFSLFNECVHCLLFESYLKTKNQLERWTERERERNMFNLQRH